MQRFFTTLEAALILERDYKHQYINNCQCITNFKLLNLQPDRNTLEPNELGETVLSGKAELTISLFYKVRDILNNIYPNDILYISFTKAGRRDVLEYCEFHFKATNPVVTNKEIVNLLEFNNDCVVTLDITIECDVETAERIN